MSTAETSLATSFPPQRIRIPLEDRQFIIQEMLQLFDSGKFAYGPWTKKFEDAFAAVCLTRHAVAMGSGTQAIEVMVRALRLKGRRVAIPNITYAATAQAVIHAGAMVHLVDVCPDDGMMDPSKLPKTEDAIDAVCVVHIGGNVSDRLGEVKDYCKTRNIPLLEDAAHAHGSTSPFGRAGAIGHASAFSFFPTKVITTGAEGGMLCSDDPEVATFARKFRHHGRSEEGHDNPDVQHELIGHNFCGDEIRSLIGWTQVNRLRQFVTTRRAAADIYREHFGPLVESPGTNFYKVLTKRKVSAPFRLPSKVYARPLHREPMFGFMGKSFPGAETWAAEHAALPVYGDMTTEEASEVCRFISVV